MRVEEPKIAQGERRQRFRGYDFTPEEWSELCWRYGNRCAICGEEKPLTVDHILPRIAGGTDDLANIQPLCLSCNTRKNARDAVTGDYLGIKKPGRKPISGTRRYSMVLDEATAEWALSTREGLSAMVRRLLSAEQVRQAKEAKP